jgi:UDP-N-acetylmuramyl pentapeptide phosphotransferase/UDP-N-acetylglucosamine-1-phosphate transferase
MNAILANFVLSFPFFCFVSATFLEVKRDRNSLRSRARILPLAVAWAASVFLLIPLIDYVGNISVSSDLLSNTMSILALLVAACGFLCRYRSRFAAVLIVLGGIVLAFFWLHNRIIN